MKPRILLEEALTPDGAKLRLYQHDGDYVITIDHQELMSTRRSQSEQRLGEWGCRPLSQKSQQRVLIGGLGCGYTLRSAAQTLGQDAEIWVAELFPSVIAWNRNPAYPFAADLVNDSRIQIVEENVLATIRKHPTYFDSILLDVDNGPAALSFSENALLYDISGVMETSRALRRNGKIIYWAAAKDLRFERLLAQCGLRVEVEIVRAHGQSGPRHFLLACSSAQCS